MRARSVIFITQQIDPDHPALAATVQKVAALARRVDEVVVLADGVVPAALPSNARFHSFGSATRIGRGARFELALGRELAHRPSAVIAHMCPIYAVLAAPLVRPLRIPLLLWFTHWKASRLLTLAERVSSTTVSVDRRTFAVPSAKLVPIGHGIDMHDFSCTTRPARHGLRVLVLGRTSPAKGIDHILRGVALARESGAEVEVDVYGPSLSSEERTHRDELTALAAQLDGAARIHDAVSRGEVPRLLAESDVLVNNMRAGATDKVVYEAAASCVPVLASNPAFDDLLDGLDLRFPREDEAALAKSLARLSALEPEARAELGRTLRERALAGHSVDAWAEKLLAAAR